MAKASEQRRRRPKPPAPAAGKKPTAPAGAAAAHPPPTLTDLNHAVQHLRRQLRTAHHSHAQLERTLAEAQSQRDLSEVQNEQLMESQRLLEESRDRYALLYDMAPVALVTLCDNGVIREINLPAAALLGQPPQRLIDVPLILFVRHESRRELLAHLRRCRAACAQHAQPPQSAAAMQTELMLTAHDGGMPIRLTSSPGIMTTNGWRFRCALVDLSDRRLARETAQRLRASEQTERLLRAVLATLPVGVRVLDHEGNIMVSNDLSRQIWDDPAWPATLGARSSVSDAINGLPIASDKMPASRALRGEPVLDFLIRLGTGPTGRIVRESAVPLGANEHVHGAVVVTEDVTAQARADQKLREAKTAAEEANRAKDQFLATVSHELRTPVSAILLWAHLLRNRLLPSNEREQAAQMIEESAKTQSQLIEELLDVSRLVSGKMHIAPLPQALQPLVLETVESMRPVAHAKGVTLESRLAPQALMVNADAARFRQVLSNLLSNAIKFTPQGGWVRISMERARSVARLAVCDSGTGIPADFLPHVFERFRQADSSLTRPQGGLGLGLAIARQIVEMHHGTIRAESKGQDMGAAFTVELPLSSAATLATAATAAAAPITGPHPARAARIHAERETHDTGVSPLHGVRVLLVDDDPRALLAIAKVIQAAGATVSTAKSAAEALDLFRAARQSKSTGGGGGGAGPDVIVSDIRMPGEDGYSLMRKLRELEAAAASGTAAGAATPGDPSVPAIALSAHARSQDRAEALRAGFQAHISKPVEAQRLIDVLSRLTRPRHATTMRSSERPGDHGGSASGGAAATAALPSPTVLNAPAT